MITNKCPECKHNDIGETKDFGNTWSVIAWCILVLGTFGGSLLLLPFLQTKYKCKKCNTEWK